MKTADQFKERIHTVHGIVLVIGASGGIGSAICDRLIDDEGSLINCCG